MNKILLLRKAYRLLDSSTPLKYDCGQLCSKKCCSGSSECGMQLFPGEQSLQLSNPALAEIRQESLGDSDVLFAVCKGSCERSKRPLACRIYPYIPYIDADVRLVIKPDPRAAYICPILYAGDMVKPDRLFIRKLYEAFHLLIEDKEIKEYVIALSSSINEYERFTGPAPVDPLNSTISGSHHTALSNVLKFIHINLAFCVIMYYN